MAKIEPTNVGGRYHQVSAVQLRGIIKKDGSTPTSTVSEWKYIEKKHKDWKRKLNMEMFAVMRTFTLKRDVGTKAPRVNDDEL